jgi:hypothetical protein
MATASQVSGYLSSSFVNLDRKSMEDPYTPDVAPIELQYPSVSLAFDVSKSAYDWAIRRLDVLDNRLQSMLQFAVGLTTAIIAFITTSQRHVEFRSVWFISAIVAFAAGLFIGVYARGLGSVIVVDPRVLFQQWLHKSEWEFRKDFIYFAAKHLQANRAIIKRKSNLTNIVTTCFMIEAVALAVWVMRGGIS